MAGRAQDGALGLTGAGEAPVGHGLDEEGLVLGHGPTPRLLGGVVHGEHVVAVHTDGQDAVARAPGSCRDRHGGENPGQGDMETGQDSHAPMPSPRYCSEVGVEMA